VEQFTLTQAGVLRWCLLLFLSIPTLCLSATNEVARTHNAGGGASSNSNFRCISSICQSFPVVYTANGYIESINGRLHDKCLKVHPIFGLMEARGGGSWSPGEWITTRFDRTKPLGHLSPAGSVAALGKDPKPTAQGSSPELHEEKQEAMVAGKC
jgi:hypothetical protein